jgi:hypothetical protein
MKKLTSLGILFAALTLMSPVVDGAHIELTFDGVTDGGWTISNQPITSPVPTVDANGTGLPGIAFDDHIQGVAYYEAPASLTSLDLTGRTLSFHLWIEDRSHMSGVIDDDSAADLVINGIDIALDVIDEGQLETLQSITVDFSNAAFAGVDLANITSFGIRAEYWDNGGEEIESYLVGVPEPASFSLASLSLLGLIFRRRRK